MSGLNLTRATVESQIFDTTGLKSDWLAMYDLLKEINDLDYPTDVRLARRFRDKIRALIGGE